MSFPYGQFTAGGAAGENYSTPSTPHDAFPQWDTIEHEQQQEIVQQQRQSRQQSQEQQTQLVQNDLHSPIPTTFPQTIQLEQQPPLVPSQAASAHDDTPVHLHPVQHEPSKPSGTMIIRSGRRQQHQQAQQQGHPYSRRQSSASAVAARQQQHQQMQVFAVQPQQPSLQVHQQREHHVHFAPPPMVRQSSGGAVASAVPSTSSARPSPLVPSPSSRITSFSSSVSNSPVTNNPPLGSTLLRTSPRTMDPPALPHSTARSAGVKGYIIRMDTHYDTDTHLLTAVLEVPGVRREHLSVKLSTCSYNRVRQITVSGAVFPPFGVVPPLINPAAAAAYEVTTNVSVRERKYGPCQRVIPVPSDLKREDIEAHLQDGVLMLRFPCGIPAEEDGEDVAVR